MKASLNWHLCLQIVLIFTSHGPLPVGLLSRANGQVFLAKYAYVLCEHMENGFPLS